MTGHLIAAIIVALIMLGGLFAIARNLTIFLVDTMHGPQKKAWFDRPYLFRALAWTFTLSWFFGPYDVLGLNNGQRQVLAFVLYVLTAASWLWVLRVSYLDGIPQRQFALGPAWANRLGWGGHSVITYLIQLVAAAGIGLLFILLGSNQLFGLDPRDPSSKPLFFLIALPFLILTGLMSFWRVSLLLGPEPHTLGETVQHIVGGREAGTPHTNEPPAPTQ